MIYKEPKTLVVFAGVQVTVTFISDDSDRKVTLLGFDGEYSTGSEAIPESIEYLGFEWNVIA